jgi:hypothetical protein
MLFEPATYAPGDTFATAIRAARIEPFDAIVPTPAMVKIPDPRARIWAELLLFPHIRYQAIARMVRKPIRTVLPNPS